MPRAALLPEYIFAVIGNESDGDPGPGKGSARLLHRAQEAPLLTQDEALLLRGLEIGEARLVGLQSGAIGFVGARLSKEMSASAMLLPSCGMK